MVDGRFEGAGTFTFASGNKYVGQFKNSKFHGKGVLHIEGGGRYVGQWENGKELPGSFYEFPDKLRYPSSGEQDWDYCTPMDRRYQSERLVGGSGIKPAPDTNLTDKEPPPPLPSGCYALAEGFYDPSTGKIHTYGSKSEVRVPDSNEVRVIRETCRYSVK